MFRQVRQVAATGAKSASSHCILFRVSSCSPKENLKIYFCSSFLQVGCPFRVQSTLSKQQRNLKHLTPTEPTGLNISWSTADSWGRTLALRRIYPTNQTKMLSETADIASGAATWRTGRNIRIVFDSDLLSTVHYMKTWRHPQDRKYITHCTAVRGGPSHGHR